MNHSLTLTMQGSPNTKRQGRQVRHSLLWGHHFFILVPGLHDTLVHPSRVDFLFPCLWNSCNQTHWLSVLQGLLSPLLVFSAGKPGMGLRTSLLWDDFWDIISFQFAGLPSGGYQNNFITIVPVLSFCCDFLFLFGHISYNQRVYLFCQVAVFLLLLLLLLIDVQQPVVILMFL